MRRGTLVLLFFIILLAAGASFVVFWPNTTFHGVKSPFTTTLGLDLQGGVSVLLEPRSGQANVNASTLQITADALENRVNGTGVKQAIIRVQPGVGPTQSGQGIIVELPGYSGNQQSAFSTLLQTGSLAFWNTGTTGLADGTTFTASDYTSYNPGNKPQFTGGDLNPSSLSVTQDSTTSAYDIDFAMSSGAATKFSKFTASNIGSYLTVTLDNKVITSAVINSAITGPGQITGNFTLAQAQQVVNVLKYGALPIILNEASYQVIGGTLGEDTILHSIMAGAIGLSIVILFMLFYYRLPGFLADIALILYSLVTFAVFKMIGVTMSMEGIAGFILSIGMAVDANVLIFERVKEELRAGRLLASAIDIGWKRAWPSIRDSNTSTMITCAILYGFGSNFGATTIVGFATTLFIGVAISMFTAIVVTRTLLNLLVPTGVINHPALFGIPANALPSAHVARRNSAA
jgi:preprotein translocase subunit SecD